MAFGTLSGKSGVSHTVMTCRLYRMNIMRSVSLCTPSWVSLSLSRRSRRGSCVRGRRSFGRRTRALWNNENLNSSGGGKQNTQSSPMSARRQALFELVSSLTPSRDISRFDVPAPVLSAMRQTVSNLLGSLPPQFFKISISTRSDNLAQLMFSVLMTGFMFCNANYRMELSKSLGGALFGEEEASNGKGLSSFVGAIRGDNAAGDNSYCQNDDAVETGLAAGSQKIGVEGSVLRWHHEEGVQRMPALEYIDQLENEISSLKRRLQDIEKHSASVSASTAVECPMVNENELLDYLKTLSADQVAELTDCASPDVLESMNLLVQRLIGDDSHEGVWGRNRKSECTATELAQLLYWLMAVGHHLRVEENKLTLTASLESASGQRNRSYGANDGDDGPEASEWVPRLPPGR